MYGTLSDDGTTITVPMGQSIYYSDYYSADVVLSWGTSIVGTNIGWNPDASVTEAVYLVEGNTITLQGGGPTPSGSDYPQYEATGLGSVWTDDGSFGGYLEWGTVLTEFVPATMPTNLTVTPDATTASVTWDGAEGDTWNLRWRPWTDLSGNPHSWDFDLENYQSDLEGWWSYDADGDGNGWSVAYSSNDQDDVCLYSFSWSNSTGGLTPDNYVGTPTVPLVGELQFTVWGTSDSWPDVFQVYAMIGEDLYPLFDEDLSTTAAHKTYTVDLSDFEGAEGSIVFRHYNCTNQYAMYIDDVFIGDPNAEIIEPAEWEYANDLTDTEHTIEGLTPETKYEVQAQAVKEDDRTDWTEIVEFITLAEQVPEPVITIDTEFGNYSDIQTVHVTVENMPDGGAIKYHFARAAGEHAPAARIEANEWVDYDDNAGITIDQSGTLTIAVFDTNGEILAQISGDFTIDELTGIEDIATSTVDNVWYNMSGMKFNGKPSAPGIYILNGKKVIVK